LRYRTIRTRILALITALAFISLSPAAASASTSASAFRQADAISVVVNDQVTTDFMDGSPSKTETDPVCSGFIGFTLGTEQIVVTAAHCVFSEVDSIFDDTISTTTGIPKTIQYFDGDRGTVQGYAYDHPHDLLFMLVQSVRKHNVAAHFAQSFQRGDDFFTLGMPEGFEWSYGRAFSMQGQYENTITIDNTDHLGLIEIGLVGVGHGNSGGAVFNANGDVVGVLDAGSDSNPTQGMMVAGHYVFGDLLQVLGI
jgi:S1-C subfamily serine protease